MVPLWVIILTSLGAGAILGSVTNSLILLFVDRQAHKNKLEAERVAFEQAQKKAQDLYEREQFEKKMAFEREQAKAQGLYEREQLEKKRERIRQAGKSTLQAAQSLCDTVTDALHLYQQNLTKDCALEEETQGAGALATTPRKPGPGETRALSLPRGNVPAPRADAQGPQVAIEAYKRLGAELRKDLSSFDDGVTALLLEVNDAQVLGDLSEEGLISAFRQQARFALLKIEQECGAGIRSAEVLGGLKERRAQIVLGLEKLQKKLQELLAKPEAGSMRP